MLSIVNLKKNNVYVYMQSGLSDTVIFRWPFHFQVAEAGIKTAVTLNFLPFFSDFTYNWNVAKV